MGQLEELDEQEEMMKMKQKFTIISTWLYNSKPTNTNKVDREKAKF